MAELTLEQKKALALAEAKLKMKQQAGQGAEDNYDPLSSKNIVGAAVEPNLSMLSGMVTTPLSGYVGLAGSMLPGPAGQGAEWAENFRNRFTYSPVTEGGQRAAEAVSYPFRKLGEYADVAGEKVSEATGSPALGAGVNTAMSVGAPMLLAKGLNSVGAKNTLGKSTARRFMQSALKPTERDLATGNAGRAVETLLKEGLSPSKGGVDKLNRTIGDLNSQVESQIAGSNQMVNVPRVGSRLQTPWDRAVKQVNPQQDMAAVRGTWDDFRTSPSIVGKTEIPVQLAHQLKKGTYQALGKKSYGELGTSSTEAQKALARGLREEVASKVPSVVKPLQREAELMNTLDVAERRALMELNKNPMGLSLLANNPYAWAGFMADRSAAFKAAVAHLLYGNPKLQAANQTAGMVSMEQPQQPE